MNTLLKQTKALSDGSRLRIMAALIRENELCVCEITAMMKLAMPTVSRHMSLLVNSGFAEARKQGRWVYYRLSEQAKKGDLKKLMDWLSPILKKDAIIREDSRFLKEVLKGKHKISCN